MESSLFWKSGLDLGLFGWRESRSDAISAGLEGFGPIVGCSPGASRFMRRISNRGFEPQKAGELNLKCDALSLRALVCRRDSKQAMPKLLRANNAAWAWGLFCVWTWSKTISATVSPSWDRQAFCPNHHWSKPRSESDGTLFTGLEAVANRP